MKLSLTQNTLVAFLIVVSLAGAALGLADETEAMLNPVEMAKLGIHRMPNGEWMQEAEPVAANDAAPAGVDHTDHIVQPDAARDQNIDGDYQNPPTEEVPQFIDHEAMGH